MSRSSGCWRASDGVSQPAAGRRRRGSEAARAAAAGRHRADRRRGHPGCRRGASAHARGRGGAGVHVRPLGARVRARPPRGARADHAGAGVVGLPRRLAVHGRGLVQHLAGARHAERRVQRLPPARLRPAAHGGRAGRRRRGGRRARDRCAVRVGLRPDRVPGDRHGGARARPAHPGGPGAHQPERTGLRAPARRGPSPVRRRRRDRRLLRHPLHVDAGHPDHVLGGVGERRDGRRHPDVVRRPPPRSRSSGSRRRPSSAPGESSAPSGARRSGPTRAATAWPAVTYIIHALATAIAPGGPHEAAPTISPVLMLSKES